MTETKSGVSDEMVTWVVQALEHGPRSVTAIEIATDRSRTEVLGALGFLIDSRQVTETVIGGTMMYQLANDPPAPTRSSSGRT
jgi:hypothetical protein